MATTTTADLAGRTDGLGAGARLGAWLLFAAAACMAGGGIIKRITGTDIDAALAGGTMADYLAAASDSEAAVVLHLSLWIVGVLLWGAAAAVLARLSVGRRTAARVAMVPFWTGVPVAVVSFVAWLGVVLRVDPSASATELTVAEVVGYVASRGDWIATALLAGIGALLLAVAGREDWAPGWLLGWGAVAAAAGLLTVVAMFTGGLSTYGQVIIPVGVGWNVAAGVVLLRWTPGHA